jgi:hypothetical protein
MPHLPPATNYSVLGTGTSTRRSHRETFGDCITTNNNPHADSSLDFLWPSIRKMPISKRNMKSSSSFSSSSSSSPSSSSSTLLLLLLLLWTCSLERIAAQNNQSLACDFPNDTTCSSTNDGVCDSTLGGPNPKPGCEDGDCVDCDMCRSDYSHDCSGCLNAEGCVWCPGDATCYNSASYAFVGGFVASCSAVDDYLTGLSGGTCTAVENQFRYVI